MPTPSPPTPIANPPILSLPPFERTSTTRLQSLYSDFSRQRHSNPVSFMANVEWWRQAFEVIVASGIQQETHLGDVKCLNSSRLVLYADASLMNRVKVPRVGKPLALGTILLQNVTLCAHPILALAKTDLQIHRSFILLSEFMALKTSLYNAGSLPLRIASYVVGKPLWWALEQMGVVGEESIFSSSSRDHHKGTSWWGEYVVVSLVEKAADVVMERQGREIGGLGDALYTLDSFRKTFAGVCGGSGPLLHEGDTKVLLKFLQRDRGVLLYEKDLIKFVDIHAVPSITAVDRGILELKSAVHNLRAQVDSLQGKFDECTRQATAALQQKRKPLALNYIRYRKHLSELLEKRLNSLSTIESTLITVEATAGDVEIMKTYESSTATLKAILAHPSLQRDNIDKTMEALAEANADARDVDESVRMGGDVATGVADAIDEGELEEEWRALVGEVEIGKGQVEIEEVRDKLEDVSLKTPDFISSIPEEQPNELRSAVLL